MPCWYYEAKELRNTPSVKAGTDHATETRYRREGARFIIDGSKQLGLKYDTCATGVVYFHRFYMVHPFRDYQRFSTAAACLFLAGKVEETPKKVKDLIKVARAQLSPENFERNFGSDPKEELMMMERILLQTIKFDLQVEHPYAHLIKFGKMIRGDKAKVGKLVQMAWTFVNDSLCTSLCLQWEPDLVAVALLYLASRLMKYSVTDWEGKESANGSRWHECFVQDATLDILEVICHQVLDLYSDKTSGKRCPDPDGDKTKSVAKKRSPSDAASGPSLKRVDTDVQLERHASAEQQLQQRIAVVGGRTTLPNVASVGNGNPMYTGTPVMPSSAPDQIHYQQFSIEGHPPPVMYDSHSAAPMPSQTTLSTTQQYVALPPQQQPLPTQHTYPAAAQPIPTVDPYSNQRILQQSQLYSQQTTPSDPSAAAVAVAGGSYASGFSHSAARAPPAPHTAPQSSHLDMYAQAASALYGGHSQQAYDVGVGYSSTMPSSHQHYSNYDQAGGSHRHHQSRHSSSSHSHSHSHRQHRSSSGSRGGAW